MIKGIFFDAHGVLYERSESPGHYAARMLEERGYRTEPPDAEQVRLRDLREQATIGRVSPDVYWDTFLSARGVSALDERTTLVERIIEKAHEVIVVPGAATTLTELKRRGFILGIITDTMYPLEWKRDWLTRIGVAEHIDAIACSTDLGVRKPDPAIYLRALALVGLTPSEAVFAGHDDAEIEGARRAGMVTVAVNDNPNVVADYCVRTLLDLLSLSLLLPLRD